MAMTREQAEEAMCVALAEGTSALADLYPDARRDDLVLSIVMGDQPRVVLTSFGDDETVVLLDLSVVTQPAH